jgi:phytol kinase
MNAWLGICGVLGTLTGVMVVVRELQRRALVGAEVGRKTVHVVMGLGCAAFPWIFHEEWPVLLLWLAATVVLAVARRMPCVCTVLGGVKRESLGEFYFPAAVAIVWLWTGGDPFFFTASLVVLALADTAGAVVGQRWGKHRFGPRDGRKSLEGSLAVAVVSFVALVALQAWLRPAAWSTVVLTAGRVTVAAVVAEAMVARGLDNLLLPVVTCLLLRRSVELEAMELAWRLTALVLLVAPFFCVATQATAVPVRRRSLVPRFFTAVVTLWGTFDCCGPLLPLIIP